MQHLSKRDVTEFDEVWDVIVVGYGFAGAAAAIAAHDAGARTLLLEKMSAPGGISIVSGGAVRVADDREAARLYIRETNGGRTPDDVIDAFIDGMFGLPAYFEDLGSINGATFKTTRRVGNYPFKGLETFSYLDVAEIPGFDAAAEYPHVKTLRNGALMFKLMDDNVKARRIEVRLGTPVQRLITGERGEIAGLWAGNGKPKALRALRGVILACGGFEAAPEMQQQYWQLQPVLSAAFLGNTGDGIRMAQDVGADIWHMWHYHGSYGFRHSDPAFPFAIRMKRLPDWTAGVREPDVQMAWIIVDRKGRRFTNEYQPYMQDTGHRALDLFDPDTTSFPYVPSHVIFDEEGRKLYPIGQIVYNDPDIAPYTWSRDNLKEVDLGILKRADSIEELAGILGCDAGELAATIERWNAACEKRHDKEFGRPGSTMFPVRKPPFYTGAIWPVVSNTQGGPVRNTKHQILNPFGEPIPRLYGAGELGSMWGYLYLAAGNLSECFISGRIAGTEAANLQPGNQ